VAPGDDHTLKARRWSANFAALGWTALSIVGLFAACAVVAVPLIFLFHQDSWDSARSCSDDSSGWDLVGVLVLAATAAIVLTPLVRAVRRRVVLSDRVLSCYGVTYTWHVPIACIQSISEPSDAGAVQISVRGDGSVELPPEIVSGPSGQTLVAALRADVGAQSAQRGGDPPPIYVATARGGRRRYAPIVLGTLVGLGVLLVIFSGLADEEVQLDQRRTAVVMASVIGVDVPEGGHETVASVILPLPDSKSVRAELTHPGRLPLAVEDRLPVEYDPSDLCNVSFVDRPVPNRALVGAVEIVGTLLWLGAFIAFVVVVAAAARRARRAKQGG
jgi:hypothetical protein